ncbi:MAG: S8/S53 family peptidase, partial [Bacteroidota bacterium]
PFLQINFDNANASIQLITQWDEPWATYCNGCPGFATPIDLFVFDTDFGFLGRIQPQFPGDAVVTFGIDQASLAEDSILIAFGFINSGQTAPNLIRFTFQGNQARVISPDFSFGGPTVKGHNNARHAISVGATSWYNTPGGAQYWNDELAGTLLSNNVEFPVITIPLSPVPSFAGGPSVLPFQTASGLGGQEILFDNNGNRLPQAETRDNPSITAPDASQTSFFGAAFNFLPGVAPWFYGTSCSAPNAAAAAALLLQASGNSLTPLEMRNLLIATATDMDNPYDNGLQTDSSDPLFATGYDLGSGHGLIDADAAIEDIVASQGIEAIGLEASCRIQVNGSTEGRFLLSNPNPFGVEITLNGWSSIRLAGETTGQAGSRTLVIGPGETEVFVGLLFGAYASLSLNWQYQAPGVFYSGFAISSKFGGWEDCSSYNGSKTSDPLTRSQLKVFPNPAKAGRLTVEYELEQSDAANLRFFDQQGRIVLQQPQSLMAGQNQFEINTSGLAPGVYILSLLGNETDLSERIVIQ